MDTLPLFVALALFLFLALAVASWVRDRLLRSEIRSRLAQMDAEQCAEPWPGSDRPWCPSCKRARYVELRPSRVGGGCTVFWRCPVCRHTTVKPGEVPPQSIKGGAP